MFLLLGCLSFQKNDDAEFLVEENQETDLTDTGDSDEEDEEVVIVAHCSEHHNLRIVPLDVWGHDLAASVHGLGGLQRVETSDSNNWLIALGEEDLSLTIETRTSGYHTVEAGFEFIAGNPAESAFYHFQESEEGEIVASWDILNIDGYDCPTYTIFMGAEHLFFATTGQLPTKNAVDFLINGEEFWGSVADDIPAAQNDILYATWWWESDFELVREHNPYLTEDERYHNRLMSIMDSTSARKRVLINQFWGDNSDFLVYLNTDSELRTVAESTGDTMEVMVQPNPIEIDIDTEYPTPDLEVDFVERVLSNPAYQNASLFSRNAQSFSFSVASWHQKFITIDDDIVYVTGMNSKQGDWDDEEHDLFDPRRMPFDSASDDREAVYHMELISEIEPRRDYGVRIEGPIVHEVREIFEDRWDLARASHSVYAEYTTAFRDNSSAAEAISSGVLSQLQLTQPTPLEQASILDGHMQAIKQAKDFILIEDQYFRAPMINEVILEQMRQEPDLLLIVVTMDVSTFDPALKYTYLSQEAFRSEFPERFLLLKLSSVALVWDIGIFWDEALFYKEDIFVHSKLRIIDDVYLSVGSANMNNRGFKYEGEMNLAVFDPAWVQNQRRRIFRQYVGEDFWSYLSDDAQNNFDLLQLVAEENAWKAEWWEEYADTIDSFEEMIDQWDALHSSGFIYPLEFSDDYFDIGSPDVF